MDQYGVGTFPSTQTSNDHTAEHEGHPKLDHCCPFSKTPGPKKLIKPRPTKWILYSFHILLPAFLLITLGGLFYYPDLTDKK